MTRSAPFDVHACALAGTNLIEASAGTGKTWNLSGLYLRLLLEGGLEVQRILVVTFTNAATAELRERIRSRIAETLGFLRGAAATGTDPFAADLVASLRSAHGLADADMIGALDLALQTFDEASIFTIHGFCQRALADTPFTAQMPLALEPLQDDGEFVAEAANDFWRRRVAGDTLDAALAAHLVQRKDSPEAFARLLKRHVAKPLAVSLWPPLDAQPIDHASLAAAHAAARAIWQAERDAIVQCVVEAGPQMRYPNSFKPDALAAAALGWDELLAGDDPLGALEHLPKKVELLGSAKLVPKKNCVAPAHRFFAAAQQLLDARAQAETLLAQARLALIRDLLAEGSAALRDAKRRRHVVAFDDMLYNLHQRLTGGDAPQLAAALRERFPAALIDEFQDTDALQFAIFQAIYGGSGLPMFLVGDPKQAIYSFRNADLHTYLGARDHAAAEYTLADNQRASEALIEGLNTLFGANPRAFMLDRLAYRAVGFGAKQRKPFVDHRAAGPAAPLQVWALPADAQSGEPLLSKKEAVAAAAGATAAEIARLVAAGRRGEITHGARPLAAGDIAVLVRSHAQGSRMRESLARLGVGSVELSQASVFHSADAEDLERILAAMLEPTREALLRAALATVWIGLDAAAIEALAADEARMLGQLQRFAEAHDLWVARGAGFMLRAFLRSEGIAARLLARADGERRLTNALHLIECLHQAAEVHAAPDALLRWFRARRTEARAADDATQLRLESDRNLVQIVTIHKAKGLEYALVFCPFLWNGRRGGFPDTLDGVEYHDAAGRTVIDYRKGLDPAFDEAAIKQRRNLEAAAEDLRLIYVALTRAMQRCVIVAGGYLAKAGSGVSAKEGNASLLNWLVAGAGQSPQEWFDGTRDSASVGRAWAALAARCPAAIAIAPLPLAGATPLADDRPPPEALAALPAPSPLPPAWWIGSFSALAQGAMHESAALDHDSRAALDHDSHATLDHDSRAAPDHEPGAVPAADAAATSGPELRTARVHEPLRAARDPDLQRAARDDALRPAHPPAIQTAPLDDDDVLRFPRGAAAGDCLHALFERVDFTAPARWPQAVAEVLREHAPTLPAALGPQAAGLRERMLLRMLGDVLHTPLPVGGADPLRLADVASARRLNELEFHLPARALASEALNDALAALGIDVPRLAFGTLRGYLRGFIDLVFEHDGRYFVLDWKSHHLGDAPADYAAAPLEAAMAASAYHLQALLYCVALDRLLRCRLPDYDPARHFGGAIYLFVRGVRPGWRDARGAPAGLHFQRPAPQAIARLSALFGEAAA